MMTKKEFIAFAEHIREAKHHDAEFTAMQISYLARFCKQINSAFNENRWVGYIKKACGPSGGKIKS